MDSQSLQTTAFLKTIHYDILQKLGAYNYKDEAIKDAYIKFLEEEKQKNMSKEESMKLLFELWKTVPNWEQYPMPEAFYKYFNVKKPKPSDDPVVKSTAQFSGGRGAPIEMREPASGGVRNITLSEPLEVKQVFIPEDKMAPSLIENDIIDESVADMKQGSSEDSLTPPKEETKTDTPPS
jgi:hypothetical protein